jgi:hypothetical protein
MLSATPFAYHFSLDYREGYLFDHPPENKATIGRYGHATSRDEFYIQNFGYRIRNGKLTQPENAISTGILERRFAERLMREGAMSELAGESGGDTGGQTGPYPGRMVVVVRPGPRLKVDTKQ